jgi:hypothetical protein
MQLRTFLAASVFGLSLACVAGLAGAQQIYKWKDANGVIHFSQAPPATGTHYIKMHLTSEPDVASSPPSSAAESGNPSETGNASRDAAASAGGKPDTPSNRAALCKQLSSNIALLLGKQPVVTGGAGKQEVLNDQARQQQLDTARAQQAQYCSGGV